MGCFEMPTSCYDKWKPLCPARGQQEQQLQKPPLGGYYPPPPPPPPSSQEVWLKHLRIILHAPNENSGILCMNHPKCSSFTEEDTLPALTGLLMNSEPDFHLDKTFPIAFKELHAYFGQCQELNSEFNLS